MPFDPNNITQFLDVDFKLDPNFVKGDNGAPLFSASAAEPDFAVIPRAEWKEICDRMAAERSGLDELVTRIYDQGRNGACVANAVGQAMQIKYAQQHGKENVVQFSAQSLYGRIGSSASSGARVSDGLEESAERGILPLNTPENIAKYGEQVMPNTGWENKLKPGWEAVAKNFRVLEWTVLRSMDQLITALLKGFPVVVGRSGHSICYCRPFYKGSALCVSYANSWGRWGVAAGDMETGFGVDSESMIRSSSRWAFCPRSVVPLTI